MVPVVVRAPARRAVRVVVSKSKRTVTRLRAGDKLLAQYPATIGGEHDPLPIGHWTITSVQRDPWFYTIPCISGMPSPNEATAKLPPGPRNPGGRRVDGPFQGALRNSWHARPGPHPARRVQPAASG